MAESQTRTFDIPWGTVLPLLAVLAGVIAQFKPLVSARPPVPSESAVPVTAKQDVDARLWQDPIAVTEKQKALFDAEIKAKGAPQDLSALHDISTLRELLSKRVNVFHENVLLLAVMVDAGPYSEQGESRLRSREAVLKGLSESGFEPVDGEHIGFVTATWPTRENASDDFPQVDRALLVPWEECEAVDDADKVHPTGTKRVFVVWLPAVNFNPNPLSGFAALISLLAPDIPHKSVKLIGPANSTGLQNMIREARTNPGLSTASQKALNDVSIISPRATVPDSALLPSSTPSPTPIAGEFIDPCQGKEKVKDCLESASRFNPKDLFSGLHFVRTIATDDTILNQLILELQRRGIAVSQLSSPVPKLPHIVILSEWDTYYGRSLGKTFVQLASGPTKSSPSTSSASDASRRIHFYYYMRGIDGQLPGDVAKDNQRDAGQKTQSGQERVSTEATEGLNHSDYLRRLARELKDDDAFWVRRDGFGIRAIGLLGSDIYDKLMILRALRPQFRGVVFFTNNYDAHFERRDDWDDTRNLIIASPFGGALPEGLAERPVAPFRDSNQTSMYVGTLVATGKIDESVATDSGRESLFWQPRIFEISRRGAYDLSSPWYLPGKDLSRTSQNWFRDWLFPKWDDEQRKLTRVPKVNSQHWFPAIGVILQSPTFWRLVFGALTLTAIAVWVSVTIASRTLPGGGTTPERLKRLFASTTFCLVCGIPVIVFSVAIFAQHRSADIVQYEGGRLQDVGLAVEPLAFFSGISIWPSEMLRLIALMLAIHFMIKANVELRANERTLTKLFRFTPLPLTHFRWADLGIGLEHWRMTRSKAPRAKTQFSAEEAWHAYLCRNKFWPRFIRIGILFTLYFLFSLIICGLFPAPLAPARGDLAFGFDRCVIVLAAIGTMILTFYVVDAIQLNSNFIRMFAREITKWGDTVVQSSHRSPPLTEEELSAYHEIFFVAQRTQVVAPLIWYPLIVLSLLFVARSSFFDNWAWSASLVIIFALNAAWPIASAMLLRRAAEQLRDATLSNLQLSRIKDRAIETKRETLDELIVEIRRLKKGAFAPLTEQPFVRAIIVPSGGLGLLALGQRLLEIF